MPIVKTTEVEEIVERALAEDLPDITAEAIFESRERGTASFVCKRDGVVAGHLFSRAVFAVLDGSADYEAAVEDGTVVSAGTTIARIDATVRALLSGERTALNLLQRASGIATITRDFVRRVEGTGAAIYDTRKTAPGLRVLDKFAVVAGGGRNHRYGLHDMYLVKNNHIDRAGSIAAAVERVRARGTAHKIMVEVRNQAELEQALVTRPDFILLDNMKISELRQSVLRTAGQCPLEASGGVTLDTVRAIAETGVQRISVGALTHSVAALDISMKIHDKVGG